VSTDLPSRLRRTLAESISLAVSISTGTVDRSALRSVQYPRGFTVDQLTALLAARAGESFDEFDEAVRAGVPITLVDGDPSAIFAELPRDTAFLEAIIACGLVDRHRR